MKKAKLRAERDSLRAERDSYRDKCAELVTAHRHEMVTINQQTAELRRVREALHRYGVVMERSTVQQNVCYFRCQLCHRTADLREELRHAPDCLLGGLGI